MKNTQITKQRKPFISLSVLTSYLLFILILSSCNPTHTLSGLDRMKNVSETQLKNKEASIEALDESFYLKSGSKAFARNQSEAMLFLHNNELKIVSNVDEIKFTNNGKKISNSLNAGDWETAYPEAIKLGAKKVRIKLASIDEDLYGILFLGKTHPKAGKIKSYKIKITKKQLKDMNSNGVGVVGEKIELENGLITLSWSLWISKKRFGYDGEANDSYSMNEVDKESITQNTSDVDDENYEYEEESVTSDGSNLEDEHEYEFEEEGEELDEESIEEDELDFDEKEMNLDFYYGIGCRLEKTDKGYLQVLEVYSDSPAERAGLKESDIIGKMNGKLVTKISAEAYKKMTSKKDNKIKLEIKRNAKKKQLTIKVGKVYR